MYHTSDFELGGVKQGFVRLSFSDSLFEARSYEGSAAKYGATLIIEKSDKELISLLTEKVFEAVTSEWGDKGVAFLKKGLIKNPILQGENSVSRKTGELYKGFNEGNVFIRAQSGADHAPTIIWRDPLIQETAKTVHSGDFGKCVLNVYTWSHPKSGNGVSFGIRGFQKLREGANLGGGGAVSGASFFEEVADAPEETLGGLGA